MVIQAISIKIVLFGMLASTSLCIGLIGILLPGLPSTEFILLAVWAADRSSPRLHSWLLRQRFVGPSLECWQKGRMPRKAKYLATVTMTLSVLWLFKVIRHTPSAII